MKLCPCQGNNALKQLERVRSIAEKAARMDNCVYIIYRMEDVYMFCKEGEGFKGTFIEYVFP